jgi:peptide/nickel transport system substrate-binding protein
MTHPGSYPGADEEMTSEDVRQTFIRRGTSFTAPDKRFSFKIAGSATPGDLAPKLQAPDRYTFTFTMAEPFVPAIREMARPSWGIIPGKVIDEFGIRLSQRAYGSGPFMLEEFKGNERVVLRRHPNYFHKGHPWLDTITHIIITDNESLLAAFESGEHDICGAHLTRTWYEEHKDEDRFTAGRAESRSYPVLKLKIKAPFSDVRVREAVDLALDREAFIDKTLDGAGQYNGPIPWTLRQWALSQDELRASYETDLQRSGDLMNLAGYGRGFDVTLNVDRPDTLPSVVAIAEQAAASVMEIGVDFQVNYSNLNRCGGLSCPSLILPGNFDTQLSWLGPIDDPDQALSAYHSSTINSAGNIPLDAFGNETGYQNAEIDVLIDAQSRELDTEKRKRLIDEAQRLIMREHAPPIPLPSGFDYSARWAHVHFPYEPGQPLPPDALPYGCDIWTQNT